MFCLQRAEFPVDTHVWKIAKSLHWIPQSYDREECYTHLNKMVPDECKYDLHVLMVEHGKRYKNDVRVLRKGMQDIMDAVYGSPKNNHQKYCEKITIDTPDVEEKKPKPLLNEKKNRKTSVVLAKKSDLGKKRTRVSETNSSVGLRSKLNNSKS